ncbi:MAG: hypothetical protein LBC31_12680, partial [Treponema sp.]|nr:hypothetical protein [Treponema sp.]
AYTISAKHIKLTSDGGPHTITHRSGHIGSLFEVTGGSLVLENITIRGNGSDGTSAIKVSSKLTMGDNAVVKDFHSLTTGGAVYIAGGTFNMEGGSITGNTAALGGGVFVNGTFVMSGAARIAGNDVYLVMGTYITTGALSGSGVVAVITPQVYAGSPQVLSNGVQRNRFSVTPDGISYYYINSSGVLVPATGGIGPGEILYGTDNADVITISSYIDGTIDAGDGDDTITVGGMNPSSIINAGNGNNTITISAVTSGTITAGDGNDSITINDWFQNGTITAGPGADTINIRYFSGGTIIDVGADTVMDTVIIREDSNSILEMRNFDPAHDKLKLKTGWSAALVGGTVEVTVAGSGKIRLTGVTNTSYGSYIELYP